MVAAVFELEPEPAGTWRAQISASTGEQWADEGFATYQIALTWVCDKIADLEPPALTEPTP